MTDLDRLVDRKLAELGLSRDDLGPAAVDALRTRLAGGPTDGMEAAAVAAMDDHDGRRREREAAAEQFAKDVAQAMSGGRDLTAPDDLAPTDPTPGGSP